MKQAKRVSSALACIYLLIFIPSIARSQISLPDIFKKVSPSVVVISLPAIKKVSLLCRAAAYRGNNPGVKARAKVLPLREVK